MRTNHKKNLYLGLLTSALMAGCFSSRKEEPKEVVKGPIMLEALPSQVNEVEAIVGVDGAVTTLKSNGEEVEEVQSFKKGEWKTYQHPLPSYQPIYSVWTKEGKEVQRSLAYHGWDLNLDGELDMFEGVDLKGKVFIKLFDYDFDGKIDHIEKLEKEMASNEELETLEVK